MNEALTQRRHRREGLELQLTAMIDIFSMIVIFLIFGTVFGAAELAIPDSMRIPRSISKEGVESAPRLIIGPDYVETSFLQRGKIPLAGFRGGSEVRSIAGLKESARMFVKELPAEVKSSGSLLNVIADQNTPYEDVFSVIRVFREAGFDSMLFVATGESVKK